MRITAISGTHEWEVRAEWLGADRAVHGPTDIFDCIAFVNDRKEED